MLDAAKAEILYFLCDVKIRRISCTIYYGSKGKKRLFSLKFFFGICKMIRLAVFQGLIYINPFNADLNPICHLLALLGTHHILHVSRIRVNSKYRVLYT
jgi:hypothetical protein